MAEEAQAIQSLSLQKRQRWLVVDFDGTCTVGDTTPMLPRLAALLCPLSERGMEDRLAAFGELEQEYFRLHAAAHDQLCHESQTLLDALDSLDDVSNHVTNKVSASGLLRGLHVAPEEMGRVLREEFGNDLHPARLRPDCAVVLARHLQRDWRVAVLSINWSPTLIQTTLVTAVQERYKTITGTPLVDDNDDEIPIWCNTVDANGVVKLHVPGAVAKQQRISTLKRQGHYVVYVGDSSTDLSALVESNLGILIGDSRSAAEMAQRWGISLAHLKQYNADADGNVLWTASSWSEIDELLTNLLPTF